MNLKPSTTTAFLSLLVVVGLIGAACGSGSSSSGGSSSGGSNVQTLKSGTLTVGSDIPYPPFEFNKGGNLTGFDVDLMDAIAKKMGLKPTWQNANFNTIFTALAANKFDVVAAAVTAYAPKGSPAYQTVQQRRRVVAFTRPYYESLQSLAVNTTKTPDIKTTDDLSSGDRVGVQTGTTGAFWAQENLDSKGVQIADFTKAPDMFNALQAGSIVGIVNDLPVSIAAIKGKSELKVVEQIATGEQYAFAVNKDNTSLLKAIDTALKKMLNDGSYAQIFNKYFPEQKLPSYAKA
jgi:polar amino acid transport system substrate-binding protein